MQKQSNLIAIFTFIAVAAITRMLPHPPNFTPLMAMALFGGAYVSDKKWAYILPLLAMLVSDFGLQVMYWSHLREFAGFHSGMIWVYGAMLGIAFLGTNLRNNVKVGSLAATGLAASAWFFIITNLGVWASGMYGYSAAGLGACYVSALPFFHYTLLGNVVFITALFGGFELAKRQFPKLATVTAK